MTKLSPMAGRPHSTIIYSVVAATAFLLSCAHRQSASKIVQLPSGEQIALIDVHGDAFVDVSGRQRHIYYVGYQTSHDMSATAALRIEARRVFALFHPQIIAAGYDTCVVTPLQKTADGDQEGRPYYFSRQPNGQWMIAP